MPDIHHLIGGQIIEGRSGNFADIFDPNTGAATTKVALASEAEIDTAIQNAKAAFPAWSGLNPQRRARIMFAFKSLLEENMDELAALLSSEHGKILADSRGDVQRGLDVVEFACGIPHLQKGAYTGGAGPDIDVYSIREPLGVCAGITPFNFPAMIPMWMFAMAIAAGNTFILKPSEKAPSVPLRLGELLLEAGAPEGVLNVVNGDKTAVDALLDHPDVKAVSFVGSSDIAHYVYARAAAQGKRVQAMGGAKNHGIILADANMEQAVKDITGAAFGSAGERCMALPVVVPVGQATAEEFVERILGAAAGLKVGISTDPDAHYGPVISAAHKAKVESYIRMGEEDDKADLILDGRNFTLDGYEDGFFIGPTIFDNVKPDMKTYQEEIFGPVLQIVRAETLEEATALPSAHQYGNGVALFTRNGRAARDFVANVNVGMVGINVPIPVPVSYHSFGGWKRSSFGDTNQYGTEGLRFWTKTKTITQRWPEGDIGDQAFIIPTL